VTEPKLRPQDVPSDLNRLALDAVMAIEDDGAWAVTSQQEVAVALAAVLPEHARQVREQVANAIEARVAEHRAKAARLDEGDRADRLEAIGWHATADHLQEGAEIARGGA
jgi:hypothetical protein